MTEFGPKPRTILFVMSRLPFPATTGRKTSLYNYCRILSKNLGYRLVVVAFLELGDDGEGKPDFIDKLVVLNKPSVLAKLRQLLIQSFVLKKVPMQASLYWNEAAKHQIDELIREEKPDIVIADMVRCTEYIRDCRCFKIADLDDRLSLRYKRQLSNDVSGINPYGAYLQNFPEVIQKVLLWAPLKLMVTKTEVALLERYELSVGPKFDRTIFVAQKECDTLNAELGKRVAFAVPIGVDVDYFTRQSILPDNHTIGFLGSLNAAHNEYSVKYFINYLLPFVKKRVPDARFLVIGGGASDSLLRLESESVHFTGRVDDVRGFLEECRVFVCPMTFGSGIKTKLIEGMSFGIPVVTTSIGAENIDAINKKDWFIEDENEILAERIVYLLNNYDVAKCMGESGRTFVKDNFTWETAERCFEQILKGEKTN